MRFCLICLISFGAPAMAQETCRIAASARTGAFMKVPIHAAPTSTSEVLDIAPEYRDANGGPTLGARFVVTEMRNGGARVTEVTDWSRTVPASDGWVGVVNIQLMPQSRRGFAVASPSSLVLWEGEGWPMAEVLLACKGDWGRVRLREPGDAEPVDAWVRGFCDDQAAPCEDVSGD